jgi:hypothetical protein
MRRRRCSRLQPALISNEMLIGDEQTSCRGSVDRPSQTAVPRSIATAPVAAGNTNRLTSFTARNRGHANLPVGGHGLRR